MEIKHSHLLNFEEHEGSHDLLDLTFAVWRVSEMVIESEFLKDKIKQLAIDIFSEYPNITTDDFCRNVIIRKVRSQIALLSLAQKMSDAKEVNFIILKNTYKKFFLQYIQKSNNTEKKEQDFLHIQKAMENLESDDKYKENTNVITGTPQLIKPLVKKQKEVHVVDTLNERQIKIVNFFNKQKERKIKLKDVTKFFPRFTDRTIRNDLRDLCTKKIVSRSNGHGKASYYYLAKK